MERTQATKTTEVAVRRPGHGDRVGPTLQAAAGNQRILQLIRSQMQAKLTVSQPDDPHEVEAERTADEIMRTSEPPVAFTRARVTPARQVHRRCTECEEHIARRPVHDDETEMGRVATRALHRGASSVAHSQTDDLQMERELGREESSQVSADAEHKIHALGGGGHPLPDSLRAFMEPRFGADFGAVRVHTDGSAALLAHEVSAQAFTVGQHIVFGAGRYAPDSQSGRRLLAHELTHVLQQGSAPAAVSQQGEPSLSRSVADEASPTARLSQVILFIESLQARAVQRVVNDRSGGMSDTLFIQHEEIAGVANGLAQLRAAAASSDERLKRSVLAAFSPEAFRAADTHVTDTFSPTDVASPAVVATAAAVAEAGRVAGRMATPRPAVARHDQQEPIVHRLLDEKLIALAEGLIAVEAAG